MNNFLGFSQYGGLKDVKYMASKRPSKPVVDRSKSTDEILDFIFAADPVTGFPVGALSHYLSDEVRPEIKQFIEQNLLVDLPSDNTLDFSPEIKQHMKDLSDDFKFDMMRGRYEDVESYKERITGCLQRMASDERNKEFAKSIFEKYKSSKKDDE